MARNPSPKHAAKPAEVIRAYYTQAQSLYAQSEGGLLAKLRQFNHPDHLTFNFIQTGTFTDKIASVKELIEVG